MNDTLIKSTNIGAIRIATERQNQIDAGRDVKSDLLTNPNGELIIAARALMKENPVEHDFPTHWGVAACRKMILKPYTERLIIAGALLAAEVDRRLEIQNILRFREKAISKWIEGLYTQPLTPDEAFKTTDNG